MTSAAILLVSALVLFASGRLVSRVSGEPLRRLNVHSYCYHLLVVILFIPTVVIATRLPFPGFNERDVFEDVSIAMTVWAVVMWTFIAIPVGALCANWLGIAGRRRKRATVTADSLVAGWGHTDRSLFLTVATMSVALVAVFVLTMPAESPLSFLVAGGSITDGQVVRKTYAIGFGNDIVRSMLNEKTLMCLSLIAYAMLLSTRRRHWKLLVGFQVLSLLAFAAVRGTASGVVQYATALFFLRSLLTGHLPRPRELFAIAGLLIWFFVFFKGATGTFVDTLVHNVFARMVFGQIVGLYFALEAIPAQHDFLGFSSSGRLLNDWLFGTSSPDYGIVLMQLYNPLGVEQGAAGHLSSVFLTEAWVNFGWVGLLAAPLWVGAVGHTMHRLFSSFPKSAINSALYVAVAMSFGYASDFVSFYYPLSTVFFVVGISVPLSLGLFLRHRKSSSSVERWTLEQVDQSESGQSYRSSRWKRTVAQNRMPSDQSETPPSSSRRLVATTKATSSTRRS